jgi:hypothetical protein
MRGCKREHGDAHVRIGKTGSGQKPCYRVSYTDADGTEQIYGSWWEISDPLSREDALTGNWADKSVGHDELEEFLAKKLQYTGPRPRSTRPPNLRRMTAPLGALSRSQAVGLSEFRVLKSRSFKPWLAQPQRLSAIRGYD